MNKIVLITGASSGIGMACAKIFAKNGCDLVLSARRIDIVNELSKELEGKFQIKCYSLELDVRHADNVFDSINNLPKEWKNISILINNAGLALGLNTIEDGNLEDWNIMIDTNVKGLLNVSKAIIPLLEKTGDGHIINIGSIAGRETYLKGNVYCATKHAVDSLTKSMRIDLLSKGIKVSQVAPGAVETEFSIVRYKGDKQMAKSVYDGYDPLAPEDVAEVVYFCASRPKNVNINDVLIMPTAQACAGIINKKC